MAKRPHQALLAGALAVGMAFSAGSVLAKEDQGKNEKSGMRLIAEKIADDCRQRADSSEGLGAASRNRCEKILERLNSKISKAQGSVGGITTSKGR